jgi:hypothetical protein
VPPTYLFAFRDEAAALRFVERLCLVLRHLAIYRDGPHVKVLDGGETDQGVEITRLARESSAQWLAPKIPRF